MAVSLTPEQLEELRQIDSATIANAIESFNVRDKTEGYLGSNVRCLFPEVGEPFVGYAVTVKGDSTTHGRRRDPALQMDLWEVLEQTPSPSVVVIQDASGNPSKSCHCGDVMATVMKALGGVAVVTDGCVRDLSEVREIGIQYFARGITVSHGTSVVYEAGEAGGHRRDADQDWRSPTRRRERRGGDSDAVAGEVAEAARQVLATRPRARHSRGSRDSRAAKYREFSGL